MSEAEEKGAGRELESVTNGNAKPSLRDEWECAPQSLNVSNTGASRGVSGNMDGHYGYDVWPKPIS